jgi:exodeoxyribonuclease I
VAKTYLFYDIETTGLNKAFDQVIQFAAIRTDLQLNEIERHEYYIKLNPDVVPSPRAHITHRISLSQLKNGDSEIEAMRKIHALLNVPETISLGYNTLGFDDEFLRFSFYRNLLPPYTHQYANGCGRMDLYPISLLYYLYKNELLSWPQDNLKLENISTANQLASGPAHNAMTDVVATLNLARKLQQDKIMWDYACGFFNKETDLERSQQITLNDSQIPIAILIDGKFSHQQHYQCAATPLGMHKQYKNQMLWLRLDLEQLSEASEDNFLEHTWVINKKIGEPSIVLPSKNRFLKPYLQSKQNVICESANWLRQNTKLLDIIKTHYQNYTYPDIANLDVSAALYSKGFMSFQDQGICRDFQLAAPSDKMATIARLSEPHLQELAIRIMGRHFLDWLTPEKSAQYNRYLHEVFSGENTHYDYRGYKRFTVQDALLEINDLHQQQTLDPEQKKLLNELLQFLNAITKQDGLDA